MPGAVLDPEHTQTLACHAGDHARGSLGASDSPEEGALWLSDLCYASWH